MFGFIVAPNKNWVPQMQQLRTLLFFPVLLLASSLFAQTGQYTVSGQIKDAETGEDLPFVNVIITDLSGVGVTSNIYGFYSIQLPPGEYTIKYQFIGYLSQSKQVSLSNDLRQNVELAPNAEVLDEVVITGEAENENVTRNEGSVTKLDMQEVKTIATFGGEPDIIKVIALNPGIKSAGEGNTGFYVRGGGLDQNLILLDEAPVYNPSHVLGFFSVFNGDALKGATLYKGGIPAEYGGRTSSVMDIRMKEGSNKDFGVSGGVGLLQGRLTVEGPIVKDKGSFIVSGRRTYIDLLTSASSDETISNSSLFFYDFNAKANYRINDKNRIFLSGYFGRDNFGFDNQFGINWGNATGTLRWNHLFSDQLFSNTSLIFSDYNYEFSFGQDEDLLGMQSLIRDLNLKQDFTYYLNNDNVLKFGFQVINHTIEPGNLLAGANTGFNADDLETRNGREGALYIQNQQNITARLNINYGLRLSAFSQFGPVTQYNFDDDGELTSTEELDDNEALGDYVNLEPRFTANYSLTEFSSLKFGYNRTAQYLHVLSNATSSSPTDVWVMSSNNIKPQLADQVSLGYFKNLKGNAYEFSSEVYYKDMQNVIDYRNGAEFFFNEEIEGDLVSGDGESYGLELQLKKKKGKLTGWVGYTLARTTRQIDEINNGEKFSARQDRTHDISLVAMYKLSKKLTLSGNFIYYTGDAVTFPAGRYEVDGLVVPVYSERNAERMPDYHRLDLSVTWQRKKTKKFESSWNFSLYNAYGRENAFTIDFRPNEDSPSVTEATQVSLFRWVPSFTYNFKFH